MVKSELGHYRLVSWLSCKCIMPKESHDRGRDDTIMNECQCLLERVHDILIVFNWKDR